MFWMVWVVVGILIAIPIALWIIFNKEESLDPGP